MPTQWKDRIRVRLSLKRLCLKIQMTGPKKIFLITGRSVVRIFNKKLIPKNAQPKKLQTATFKLQTLSPIFAQL